MTTKPRTRKAPATDGAELDPIFAAIAGHKALAKEAGRLEAAARAARNRVEKKWGEWLLAPNNWPGEAIVSPFYDRWNLAGRAEGNAAMRMARTKPTTPAGAAAMIAHARREIEAPSDGHYGDWVMIALKTVAVALTRMTPPSGKRINVHDRA
jgi:hypothetical protein